MRQGLAIVLLVVFVIAVGLFMEVATAFISISSRTKNFWGDEIFLEISDFYLDSKSKCIDVGMEVKDFHVYGENFFGDAPDVGALEFYVAISLSSPTNINISATSTTATVSWNSVVNANSYKIYRSTDPYGTYSYYTSTTGISYPIPTSGLSKYFYYIIASTDAKGELDNNGSIDLDKKTITITKPKVKIIRKENRLSNR